MKSILIITALMACLNLTNCASSSSTDAKLAQAQASMSAALLARTELHYRSIAKGRLAKFLKGWLNRNNDLRKFIAS